MSFLVFSPVSAHSFFSNSVQLFATVTEHKRQAKIEQGLRRKLVAKIELEREAERRAKEAAAEWAKRNRPLSQREIDQKLALHAAATALAVSRGREAPTLANFRECSGIPRPVGDTRKNED